MTLVQGRADDRIRASARRVLAGIRLCTGIAIATRSSVAGGWIGALTRHGVAGACEVTLILRRANDGARAHTGPILARIRLCAGVSVGAGEPVGSVRVRAEAARSVARTGDVTLIERSANDRIPTNASTRLARVGEGALIAVIAGRSIRLLGVDAPPRDARTLRDMTLILLHGAL